MKRREACGPRKLHYSLVVNVTLSWLLWGLSLAARISLLLIDWSVCVFVSVCVRGRGKEEGREREGEGG